MAQKSEKLWIFNGEEKKNPIRIHFRLTNLVWFGFSGVDCGWTQWENRTLPAVEMKNIRKGTRETEKAWKLVRETGGLTQLFSCKQHHGPSTKKAVRERD